jgi:hypothetical protein
VTDLDRFTAACAYPGELDEQAVERELAAFLRALGMSRRIVRLRAGQRPEADPPLNRSLAWILAALARGNFRLRAGRAPFRAVRALRAAQRRLRVTIDGDPDLDFRLRAARAALATRDVSDAGAAEAALATLHRRVAPALDALTAAMVVARLVACFFGWPVLIIAAYVVTAAVGADPGGYGPLVAIAGAAAAMASIVDGALARVCRLAILAAAAVVALGCTRLALRGALAPYSLAADSAGATLAALAAAHLAERARERLAARRGARAFRTNWWGSVWELSWTVCALFDAIERGKPAVEAWLRPLFEAFVSGCWLIYWEDDTLYWVAKPTVHREPGTQRLHHDAHGALESDVVNVCFWHGVRVPRFVIVSPDLITIARIDREENAEVRRVMIERYRHGEEIHGAAAFIRDAGGRRLDHDERYGTLWRLDDTPARVIQDSREVVSVGIPGDEAIVMIEVVNRTPEPDGSFKHYWLRVPPTMRTAREAVAWTFDMRAKQYAPEIET